MIAGVFRDVVNSMGSPLPAFGVGAAPYQNLQGDNILIDSFGIWLLPFNIDQTFQSNGVFFKRYNVILHFGNVGRLWDSEAQLEDHIEAMDGESDRFLVLLENHPKVTGRTPNTTGLANIRKEPIYHTQDLNLTGYAVSLQIDLEVPAFDYCDTTIVPSGDCIVDELSCDQLEDLTDEQHACIIPNIINQTLLDNLSPAQQVFLIANLCGGGGTVDIFHSTGAGLVASLSCPDTFDIPAHDILDATGGVIVTNEFDVDYTLPFIYSPPPTSQFASFRTGDDYDMWTTEFVGSMGSNGVLRRPIADRWLLDGVNVFAHIYRFTGTTGGYWDHLTSDYKDASGAITTRALAFTEVSRQAP